MNTTPPSSSTIFIPYMCDHFYALAAAMEYHRLNAVVLPPPDRESLSIGLSNCRGRECLPCIYTTGDIIRQIKQPDFDPATSVFLMPTGQGPCRFGQYLPLQRELTNRLGVGEIQFGAPSGENSYQGFGENPMALRTLIWEGIVAVDLLLKLLHENRPYELIKGESCGVYRECLKIVIDAVKAGGKYILIDAMQDVANRFESVAVVRDEPRPLIGIVGEIYVRVNPHVNNDIELQVEAAGGEVLTATVLEWLYFTNWCYKTFTWEMGAYWDSIKMTITDYQQTRIEKRLTRPVSHLLKHAYETPVKDVLERLKPIFDPMLGLEVVLTLGKGIDMASAGVSGIVNVMPFNCMSGIISMAMADLIRERTNHIPWLNLIYDGQERTNMNTRLEAFMYQAKRHQEMRSTS